MELNTWSVMTLLPILLAQLFAQGGKSQCPESVSAKTWCNIQPTGYTMIEVSKETHRRITCTIPNLSGSTATFVNHLGQELIAQSDISSFLDFRTELNDTISNYHLNITWTPDGRIQEQLKVIQCIASFHELNGGHPCRTSLVNVNFATNKQVTTDQLPRALISPTTTSIEESPSPNEIEQPSMDLSSNHGSKVSPCFVTVVLLLLLHLFVR